MRIKTSTLHLRFYFDGGISNPPAPNQKREEAELSVIPDGISPYYLQEMARELTATAQVIENKVNFLMNRLPIFNNALSEISIVFAEHGFEKEAHAVADKISDETIRENTLSKLQEALEKSQRVSWWVAKGKNKSLYDQEKFILKKIALLLDEREDLNYLANGVGDISPLQIIGELLRIGKVQAAFKLYEKIDKIEVPEKLLIEFVNHGCYQPAIQYLNRLYGMPFYEMCRILENLARNIFKKEGVQKIKDIAHQIKSTRIRDYFFKYSIIEIIKSEGLGEGLKIYYLISSQDVRGYINEDIAAILIKQDRVDEAFCFLEDYPVNCFFRAQELIKEVFESKGLEQAIDVAKRLGSKCYRQDPSFLFLCTKLAEGGDVLQALAFAKEIKKSSDTYAWAINHIVKVLVLEKQFAEAERAVSYIPEDQKMVKAQTREIIAEALADAKEYDQAICLTKKISDRESQYKNQTFLYIVEKLLEDEKIDQALNCIADMLSERCVERDYACLALVRKYAQRGEFNSALFYASTISLEDERGNHSLKDDAYYSIAIEYIARDEFYRANKITKKMQENSSKIADVFTVLAIKYAEKEKQDQAIEYVRKISKEFFINKALSDIIKVYIQQDKIELAESTLKLKSKISDEDFYRFSNYYLANGNTDKALEFADKAFQHSCSDNVKRAELFASISRFFIDRGDLEAALHVTTKINSCTIHTLVIEEIFKKMAQIPEIKEELIQKIVTAYQEVTVTAIELEQNDQALTLADALSYSTC